MLGDPRSGSKVWDALDREIGNVIPADVYYGRREKILLLGSSCLVHSSPRKNYGILCFMTPMTQAQTATTGQIVGVVTDPSGAGRGRRKSRPDERRRRAARIRNRRQRPLHVSPARPRRLSARNDPQRIRTVKPEGIAVKITESSVVDVALKVAGSPTAVSVTGESPLVQTESSARGTVIDDNLESGVAGGSDTVTPERKSL